MERRGERPYLQRMADRVRIAARALFGDERNAVLQRLAGFTVLAALFVAAGGFERIAAAFAGNPRSALPSSPPPSPRPRPGSARSRFSRSAAFRASAGRDARFRAGVMLAAAAFSLVVPGLAAGKSLTGSRWLAGAIVAAGVLAGGAAIAALDRWLPHEHVPQVARRVWLFVFAIALHNLPEGLAVGVGFGQEIRAAYARHRDRGPESA